MYHLFVWDFSKRGLDAGAQAFPVALRAYFKHVDQPPSRKEAALLVPVFLLRTGLLLAECVDELERDDLDIVLRARKSGVDVDSFRGVGAPPLMKRDERVAILQRRQKTLLRVWRTLYKKRDWLREIFEESGPKLLETSATLKLLPPSESAVVVLTCVEINQSSGRPENRTATPSTRWRVDGVRAPREPHRHAIEQASRRRRGG